MLAGVGSAKYAVTYINGGGMELDRVQAFADEQRVLQQRINSARPNIENVAGLTSSERFKAIGERLYELPAIDSKDWGNGNSYKSIGVFFAPEGETLTGLSDDEATLRAALNLQIQLTHKTGSPELVSVRLSWWDSRAHNIAVSEDIANWNVGHDTEHDWVLDSLGLIEESLATLGDPRAYIRGELPVNA